MILAENIYEHSENACPHTRGDDPFQGRRDCLHIPLVPTRVGMILCAYSKCFYWETCPHTRGDDPNLKSS